MSATETPKAPTECRDCLQPFRYGDIVARVEDQGPVKEGEKPKISHVIVCETCARKRKSTARVVVYGSAKPSSIGRDRAQRNLKRLARMQKRQKKG